MAKHCMPRNILYVIFFIQLVSTAERQIFDFMGYMWLPILANFFNIIFVIFGLFGLYQLRFGYLVAYVLWTFLWLGFNVFIICYYLSVGELSPSRDLLSFGAGSFSWWLINTPGCQPHYNTTLTEGLNPRHPLRPSYVEGCHINYESVEVTHAGIQLLLSILGFSLAIYMIDFIIKVINPKREKQGLKAMYSIEYSPHRSDSHPNTLERETDMQELESGEARAHMTPRRVKRRSYRNSARSSKSLSRQQQHRSGTKSARSSSRSHKSINPVTRLIDADQNRADSSTSNDYGQINPGFTGEVSRPNSIYNLSGPPTDLEASRPQSTLTSYSNFHGQRRLPPSTTNPLPHPHQAARNFGATSLTQESLMNHDNLNNMNNSYDDLPPPPPPLSSSPSPPCPVSDSDNSDSVVTAQMPVPQTRSSIRRNEYVNIPVQPQDPSPVMMGNQEPEPQSPGPRSISAVPGNNYVNYPGQYNGARPRTTNPLYGKAPAPAPAPETIQPDYETRLTYEAETLRADTKLSLPTYYNQERVEQPPTQRPYQPVPQSDSQGPPQVPSEAAMKRIPSGHQARDRASLRQRQRKEMEARAKQGVKAAQGVDYVNTNQYNGNTEYGVQQINGKPNGYADMSGGKRTPDMDDKWYLKDSMRPVGAAAHGQACKCYRCQRKLTAI